MNETDNLLHERRCLLEFGLPLFMDFWPDRIPRDTPHMLTMYLSVLLGRLARCYWLGLADQARPRLETMIDWMRWHDPDEFVCRRTLPRRELSVWETREDWWEILGLASWLAHGADSAAELGQALMARWDKWQALDRNRHARELAGRDVFMSQTLALALAARRPEVGAHLYALIEHWEPQYRDSYAVRFGRWACYHLANGGARDGEYVRAGIDVLLQNVEGRSALGASREHLLWLKVVWFDSGMVPSAEEAIAREYECLGMGIRPDFLPRRVSFL